MKIISRISVYIIILVAILHNMWWLALPLVVVYSLRCGASSLVVMAILLDGYFGNFNSIPYLSLCSVVWYLVASYLGNKVVSRKFT